MDLKEQIETYLAEFWEARALAISEDPLATDELGAPLDSLSACEAFLYIDELVGEQLPVDLIIRRGGYESQEQFVEGVCQGILQYLEEKPR